MRKYLIFVCAIFLITGCSANVNINIDENKITENVEIVAENQSEYNQITNWNGFPLTLYYDQELENPFADSKEKESGVPYYDTSFNEVEKKVTGKGTFNYNTHKRSSLVKNCFNYYEIRKFDENYVFSTSNGLTCDFTNFNIKITTPYKVVQHNAQTVSEINNTYIWNVNNANKNDISIYFEIDTSEQDVEDEQIISEGKTDKKTDKDSDPRLFVIGVLIIATIFLIIVLFAFNKKKKISEI